MNIDFGQRLARHIIWFIHTGKIFIKERFNKTFVSTDLPEFIWMFGNFCHWPNSISFGCVNKFLNTLINMSGSAKGRSRWQTQNNFWLIAFFLFEEIKSVQ